MFTMGKSLFLSITTHHKHDKGLSFYLRQLSESLKLIGSAMFGATFNLVTRVRLP